MATEWGERPLDQITASDIAAMRHTAAAFTINRRNSGSGRHAGEHVIAAARAIYVRAIADCPSIRSSAVSPGAGWWLMVDVTARQAGAVRGVLLTVLP